MAGGSRHSVIGEDVLETGGERLIENAGDVRHPSAIEGRERQRGITVLAMADAIEEVVPDGADSALGAVAEAAVDAGPQVAEGSKVLLQRPHEGIVACRRPPEHEAGTPIRWGSHRPRVGYRWSACAAGSRRPSRIT